MLRKELKRIQSNILQRNVEREFESAQKAHVIANAILAFLNEHEQYTITAFEKQHGHLSSDSFPQAFGLYQIPELTIEYDLSSLNAQQKKEIEEDDRDIVVIASKILTDELGLHWQVYFHSTIHSTSLSDIVTKKISFACKA